MVVAKYIRCKFIYDLLLDNDYTLHIHDSGICRDPIKGIYKEKTIYVIILYRNRKQP